MTARILIVDGVATNRIVMMVKMQAAQFAVAACATLQEAEAEIARKRPDLILFNPSDGGAGLKAFDHARGTIGAAALGRGEQFFGREPAVTVRIGIGETGITLRLQFFQRQRAVTVEVERCKVGTLVAMLFGRRSTCRHYEA